MLRSLMLQFISLLVPLLLLLCSYYYFSPIATNTTITCVYCVDTGWLWEHFFRYVKKNYDTFNKNTKETFALLF